MSTTLETLKSLKAQVDGAIAYIENGMPMKDLTPLERARFMFHYDLIVGDFGITKISGCKTCRPRYEKETREKD